MSDLICPLCPDPSTCRAYPLCWQRLRAGRDVAHWTKIHNDLCGITTPTPAPTYPPIATQLSNAVGAAGRAIAAVVSGEKVVVSTEEQERRLAVCHGCDRFDAKQDRCSACGCFSRWKSILATEVCPLSKW